MNGKRRPSLLTAQSGASIFQYVVAAIALFVFAVVFTAFWFRGTYVAYEIVGDSMLETLHGGDWVYGAPSKRAARGDIVILDVADRPSFSDDTIIKRLIAVEGDTVMCENGAVLVRYAGTEEFVRLDEPYAVGACPHFSPCELKEGEIFVLGDNRGPSHDSTEEGPLRADNIVAVVPAWSLSGKSAITRWETFRYDARRFFRQIFS